MPVPGACAAAAALCLPGGVGNGECDCDRVPSRTWLLSALPFGGARPLLSFARFLLLLRLLPDERAWTLTPDDDSCISSWLLSLLISLTFRAEADVGLLCLLPCLDETAGAVSRWTIPFASFVFALYADALAPDAPTLLRLPWLLVVIEAEVAGVLLFGIADVEARDEAEDEGSDDADLHGYEYISELGRFALVLRWHSRDWPLCLCVRARARPCFPLVATCTERPHSLCGTAAILSCMPTLS